MAAFQIVVLWLWSVGTPTTAEVVPTAVGATVTEDSLAQILSPLRGFVPHHATFPVKMPPLRGWKFIKLTAMVKTPTTAEKMELLLRAAPLFSNDDVLSANHYLS